MVLELKSIDKSFGEKDVLKGVSFTAEGEKRLVCLAETAQVKQRAFVY